MIIEDGKVLGCGVMVMEDYKVLLGLRSDGQGWCLAGGKVEEGESIEESAERELLEEFGIVALGLSLVGIVDSHAMIKGVTMPTRSHIFHATSCVYPNELQPNREMIAFKWLTIQDALSLNALFTPTRLSLELWKKGANAVDKL